MKTAKVKFLIAEPEIFDTALSAATEYGILKSNIFVFDVHEQPLPAGFRSWMRLSDHGKEDWVRFDDAKTCTETIAGRFFSSGTTGKFFRLFKFFAASKGCFALDIPTVEAKLLS